MHNAGHKALGIDDKFTYVARRVKIAGLPDFIKEVKTMKIKGISCTIPHKIQVIKYLDEIDKVAKKIGAVNTVINSNSKLKGYNTDWLGIVVPLEKTTSLKNKKVAVLGSGGTTRAAVYGLTKRGAKVTIYARSAGRAMSIVKDFECEARSFDSQEEIQNADIIFNATPIGLYPKEKETPIDKKFISNKQIVFDAIYNPYETRLLREAKEQGAIVIHGMEMLLQQGMAQFKLFTGHDAPEKAMRDVLYKNL